MGDLMHGRRKVLRVGARWMLATTAGAGLTACASSDDSPRFARMGDALSAIEAAAAQQARMAHGWSLPEVLNHVAQGIEYSIGDGFPQLQSALFRHTVGRAAFAVFDVRGAMSHSLTEPIPGAPSIAQPASLQAAAARCMTALQRLQAFGGTPHPHFAYGALTREQNQRAHLMHLANHWTALVRLA